MFDRVIEIEAVCSNGLCFRGI